MNDPVPKGGVSILCLVELFAATSETPEMSGIDFLMFWDAYLWKLS